MRFGMIVAAGLAVALAGFGAADAQTAKKKPAPAKPRAPIAAPVLPPPPPPPPVQTSASDQISRALNTYAAFQHTVTNLRATRPASGKDVEALIDTVSGYNPQQLARGWMAYGALAASQSPAFASEVRKVAAANGVAQAVEWFSTKPHYPRFLLKSPGVTPGAEEAISLILSAAGGDADRVFGVGDSMRMQALDLQGRKVSWATARLTRQSGETRRQRILAAGRTSALALERPEVASAFSGVVAGGGAMSAASAGGRQFWDAVGSVSPATAEVTSYSLPSAASENLEHATAVDVMLSIAALRVLDGLGAASGEAVDKMLANKATNDCFASAHEVFAQCVSAAASFSDNVACVGAEALQSRASCIRRVAQR